MNEESNIQEYGDLTNEELLEFLNEIEDEDTEIQEAQSNLDESEFDDTITNQLLEHDENEVIDFYSNDNDDIQELAYSLPDTIIKPPGPGQKGFIMPEEQKRKLISVIRKKSWDLRQGRIRIQRFALNQDNIALSDPIGNNNIKLLIYSLTYKWNNMVKKYEFYINKRFADLLRPLIPATLKTSLKRCPKAIVISPGFLYETGPEYMEGLTYWATPYIPYFFDQGTEPDVLRETKPRLLVPIDRAIYYYHKNLEICSNKELEYASKIIKHKIVTYRDLLAFNPFWFESLYKSLIKTEAYDE